MPSKTEYGMQNIEYRRVFKKILHSTFYILNARKGFTLIELMVAISIVAIIASAGIMYYTSAQKNVRIARRIDDLKTIQTALETYKTANGKYPTTASGGCISIIQADLVPDYLPVLPSDPLGDSYCYRYFTNVPTGSMYKVSTKDNLPKAEMNDAAFRNKPSLIDPAFDGGGDPCKVDPPTGGVVTRWAIYSFTGTSCTLTSES